VVSDATTVLAVAALAAFKSGHGFLIGAVVFGSISFAFRNPVF
jgi:hypothetical protein